jgi:AcrR family transcriptional regulator
MGCALLKGRRHVVTELPKATDRGGRPAATSAHALAATAQRLFLDHGFEQTSVGDIADAAGISRRTFFRYFPTKADVLWVESATELDRFRARLHSDDGAEAYEVVVTRAVLAALAFPDTERDWALRRARLVLTVPSVQGHASWLYGQWRTTAREYAAIRTGRPSDALFPITVGHAVVAALLGAHEYWIAHPDSNLFDTLAEMLSMMLPSLNGRR